MTRPDARGGKGVRTLETGLQSAETEAPSGFDYGLKLGYGDWWRNVHRAVR